MMNITLFDDNTKILEGPMQHNGDIYTYYNDSARPEVGNMRALLEKWFGCYPEDEKQDLKSRFQAAFNPTFYELYIYILFQQMGYTLSIHPELPDVKKCPDYLATKGEEKIYIEVKHIMMLTQNDQSLQRMQNTVLDALNKVDATNFLLKLDSIVFKDGSQPSGKMLIKFFNEALAVIDPDIYTADLIKNTYNGMPKITYDDDKITLEIQLIPKYPIHRGMGSGAIGSLPIVTQIGNDTENIISALETKASRYGHLNAPYIICVNKQSVSFDVMEVQEALYGSWEISWSEDSNNRDEKSRFSGNGFFGSKHNPKATRVSGIYVTNANTANLTTTAGHVFRHNHFAKFPVDLEIMNSIAELLNVPKDYPFNKGSN
ncbi:hypothetical protein J2799_001764 [Chryseobacterium vietnamense]|uniref:hypothetical protein n=1 Tax=Chryseobacterium vietnamense TaxID=866785 RepID=UPI00285CACF7|nr:hypothetical protein [Chryseobacterium vietnamense]MDR6487279.1 hypothetical protein [Chryseobacterium vietnamense]